MSQKAQVKSLDAIEAFRSHLIVYLSQARPALEEVSAEVVRIRMWLENEQRLYWEHQLRRRRKELEQAQQALFSGRLGVMKRENSSDQILFHRAKREVEAAEEKLRMVKRWAREFESQVMPLLKQTEKLHTVLSQDMPKAVAYLTQVINTIAAYSETQPVLSEAPAPPSAPQAAPTNSHEAPKEGRP